MKQLTLIFSILLLFSSTSFAEKLITITEECVYLDELTAPHIPHNKVTCGFAYGETKNFPKEVIQNHINRAGIKATVVDGVKVTRSGEKLSEEEIRDIALSQFNAAYPDLNIKIEQVRFPKDMYAEKTEDFNVTVDTSKFGAVYAEVHNGKKRSQVYMFVRAFKEGYMTTDRVKVGDTLADKSRLEQIDITTLRGKLLENVEGVVASKVMSRGRIITTDVVGVQPSLMKGETVRIVYNDGLIKIEATGVAEENAFIGKIMQVKNLNSQKIISASYLGNGIVKPIY